MRACGARKDSTCSPLRGYVYVSVSFLTTFFSVFYFHLLTPIYRTCIGKKFKKNNNRPRREKNKQTRLGFPRAPE